MRTVLSIMLILSVAVPVSALDQAEALFEKGMRFYEDKDYIQASGTWLRALEKDPANYEFVRRVLGHKNLQTTINFYIGLETVDAVRKFSALVLENDDCEPKL